MRILHTSDWHLGKNIGVFSRLNEQRQALDELIQVCKSECVDLVIVSGDIFDTFIPKAEAEELFYQKTVELGKICNVICLSGNHDDGERLAAPKPMASGCRIHLINDVNDVKLKIDGEKVNIGVLPYPFISRILRESKGDSNEQRIKGLIERATNCFDSGVNIFASHLFILGSMLSEDRELGTAPLLSESILPDCDYIALGHIHRTQKLKNKNNCYYSGSLLNYSFDDLYEKKFLLYDTVARETKEIKINSGKKMLVKEVDGIDEADFILSQNLDKYVKLVYSGNPLMPSDMKRLKSYGNFCEIKVNKASLEGVKGLVSKADYSPKQLFSAFYFKNYSTEPSEELTQLFLSLLGGEEDETD